MDFSVEKYKEFEPLTSFPYFGFHLLHASKYRYFSTAYDDKYFSLFCNHHCEIRFLISSN